MLANAPITYPTVFNVNGRFPQILKLSAAAAGLGLAWTYHQPLFDMVSVISDREAVAATLDQLGIFAPLLLGFVLILQVIIAAIPGHALIISGGFAFGFFPALALSLTATVIGSQISFMLARRAGRPLIERLAPVELLDKWSALSEEKGLVFFLFAFMLPVFPADIMNFIAGLSGLSARRFFIANLFGRMPGVVLLTAVGSYGLNIPPIAWVGVAIVAAITFIGLRVFFANK